MSLVAFENIDETVGSIAALAWLFYLAIRIEGNTEIARAATDPSVVTSIEIRDLDT